MTTALAWFVVALGALVGMVVAMTLVGYCLPRRHVASRSLALLIDPEQVWKTLIDYPGQMSWRRGLTAVERRPDSDGAEVWLESFGRNAVDFRTAEATPPSLLVRRIDDEVGPFRGRWEFSLEPGPALKGCRVTLPEHGEVDNPFFRFVTRFVIGPATTLEGFLKDLAAKFGAAPRLEADAGPVRAEEVGTAPRVNKRRR